MSRIPLLAVLALASACHRSQPAQGPFERAGQGLDTATDKTGQALSTAAEKTGKGLSTAAHATGKAFGKVGDKLQGNGSAPKEATPPPASSAR